MCRTHRAFVLLSDARLSRSARGDVAVPPEMIENSLHAGRGFHQYPEGVTLCRICKTAPHIRHSAPHDDFDMCACGPVPAIDLGDDCIADSSVAGRSLTGTTLHAC